MSVTAPSGSGSCPDWFRTWIIRIPIADHIYGRALFMDPTTTPQTKDYNVYAMKTSQQYIDECYYKNGQNCKVSDNTGCYQIYIPPALSSNDLNIYSHIGNSTNAVSLKNIPDSGYIESRLYPNIMTQVRSYEDSLNSRKVFVNKIFSGSLLGGLVSTLLLQLFNYVTGSNYSPNLTLPMLVTFNRDSIESLVTKYSNYVKPYQENI